MIERKLNGKIWFFIILLGGIVPVGAYGEYMMWTGQVRGESGEPLEKWLVALTSALMIPILCAYSALAVSLIRQVIQNKSRAFTFDSEGIHGTVTGFMMFAFAIVLPVKTIPWSAVTYIDRSGGFVYIRVKTSEIEASRLARLIIKIRGYSFCSGFTKDGLSEDDMDMIEAYCRRQSAYLKDSGG